MVGGNAGGFVHALAVLQLAFPLLVQTKFGAMVKPEYVTYRFVPNNVVPHVPLAAVPPALNAFVLITNWLGSNPVWLPNPTNARL